MEKINLFLWIPTIIIDKCKSYANVGAAELHRYRLLIINGWDTLKDNQEGLSEDMQEKTLSYLKKKKIDLGSLIENMVIKKVIRQISGWLSLFDHTRMEKITGTGKVGSLQKLGGFGEAMNIVSGGRAFFHETIMPASTVVLRTVVEKLFTWKQITSLSAFQFFSGIKIGKGCGI